VVSIALAVGTSGTASGATATPKRPQVDLSALTVEQMAAGTPQTTADVATTGDNAMVSGRALASDYVEEEFLVRGEASTYDGAIGTPVTVTATGVPYATRVLVRHPANPKQFSGRVVLEPLNTSNGGKDFDVVWGLTAPMLQERGDAWVGVTERTSAGTALQAADPTRYSAINVPSNDVAWDVLAQVGAAIKEGGAKSPLRGLKPKHLYMAGYSQSGVDTAGFAMGLSEHFGTKDGDPVYDGFFAAANASNATPRKAGTSLVPKFETPVWTGVGVPVVNVEDQSDLEGFIIELPPESQATIGVKEYVNRSSVSVRRADSDKAGDQYRLYEVAGMPHGPGGAGGCEGPASTFPIPAVVRGTFALLNRWVETGKKPPRAPRVKMAEIDTVSTFAPDENGNVVGGVRSPYLDEALVRYEAKAPGPVTCHLAGHEVALDGAALAKKYPSVDAYMKKFTKGLDAMIQAGYVLPMDRAQLIAAQQEKATQVLSG
jgi:hypothetical protein